MLPTGSTSNPYRELKLPQGLSCDGKMERQETDFAVLLSTLKVFKILNKIL